MKTKVIYLILLIALIFPTFSFFLGNKMFTFNDETQIANFHQYFKALDLGQFPPRWAPDMQFEYGSPFPSFNYQLPYYLGYLGHLAGIDITITFKLLLALTLVVGAFGFYALGISLTGSNLFALGAAVLYTYTPYQSIDHYVRGAIGESFALALFPWLFYGLVKLFKKDIPANRIWVGVTVALILLSHQPAALFSIPLFFIIFGLTGIFSKKLSLLISLIKSLLLGLALSAYYWIPVIFEKRFIQTQSAFNYKDQFPFVWQLIFSRWTYTGANPFSPDTFSFQIGIPNLIVLLLASILVVASFSKNIKDKVETWQFRLVTLSTFLVIFLMNIRSINIWNYLPLIKEIQFPWRLLMFTTFFTPVLFLYVVRKISPAKANLLTAITIFLSLIFNLSYFKPGLVVDYNDSYYFHRFLPRAALKPGETISGSYLQHTEDYVPLPKGAIRPRSLPTSKLSSTFFDTKINTTSSNPLLFRAEVENRVAETLSFHSFNYPGWEVTVDGFKSKIKNNDIGAITFDLTPGKHNLVITFVDTPVRLFSNIISLGTIVFTTAYLIYQLVTRLCCHRSRKPKVLLKWPLMLPK